jgi:hypothetical protein
MQISNTRPEIPVPAERAAPFHRLHDTYVQEVDGEPVDVLSPQLICDWLIKYKDDDILFEAIHDVIGNLGIGASKIRIRQGLTDPKDILIDNREPPGGLVLLDKEGITIMGALLVEHEKKKQVVHRDTIISFLNEVGLEPNLPRLRAELCPTCGK